MKRTLDLGSENWGLVLARASSQLFQVRCHPFTPNFCICAAELVTLSSDTLSQAKSCVSTLPLWGTVLLGKLWSSDFEGQHQQTGLLLVLKSP